MKNISYGCLANVIREGGFIIVVIVRSSAIPAHFATTIFATCGMSILVFVVAALLTMPKQLIPIYIGVLFEQKAEGTETDKSRKISNIILIITTLLTIVALMYVKYKSKQVLPDVIYRRRKARQAKIEAQANAQLSHELGHSHDHSDATPYGGHSGSDLLFSPTEHTESISGLSKTATVNPHEGSSCKPYGPYLELPQFSQEDHSSRK